MDRKYRFRLGKWNSTGCYLALKSSEHLFNIHLPSKAGLITPRPVTSKNIGDQAFNLNIYNTSNAEILIKSPEGSIGYVDSLIVDDFANARPIIPKTGKVHPPIGYTVPQGDYSIQVNNFTDSSSYIFFMDESTIYNYRRHDAVSSETDMFSFSNGLGIENIDASNKKISLETVIEEDSSEKVFVTDNMLISQNDSIHVNEFERDKLILKNFGSAKNYNLQVRSANPSEAKEFNHVNISLSNKSSHQVVPDWNNLDLGTVKILIDNGNDGSIDDSMFVSNDATGIDDFFASNNPNEFHLYQNYPNPFNPTTTISFNLPKQSHITLKVYNILGQEVAILMNEVKSAGSYREVFNASSLPSGVYVYKLTAGSYIETKKMLLLK